MKKIIFFKFRTTTSKNLKSISGPINAKSLKLVLNFFVDMKFNNTKILNHIKEYLEFFDFKKLKAFFFYNSHSKTTFATLPLKRVVDDFYCNNNILKNSIVMAKCSQQTRKKIFNFF